MPTFNVFVDGELEAGAKDGARDGEGAEAGAKDGANGAGVVVCTWSLYTLSWSAIRLLF